MRFFKSLLVLLFLFSYHTHFAQTQKVKQPRILILLDGSSSMNYEWVGTEKRFQAASRIILALMDSMYKVNKDVEFGLRVYGHQYPSQENNCYDTRLEVMFSKNNLDQMGLRLAALRPIGVSPIAFSLKEAAELDFEKPHLNSYSLILVTDGAESCGGNICDVVKQLLDKKIDFKPYILSLTDNTALKNGYECLGTYLPVVTQKDFNPAVGKIVEAYREMFVLQKIDKKLLREAIVNAPSVLKVDIPKFKVTQEETPKPKPVITPPPVVIPPVKQPEPTQDLTNRTNENPEPVVKTIPKVEISMLRTVGTDRSFRIFYATQVVRSVKIPFYTPPVITEELIAPKPPVVAAKPPAPKPIPVQKTEPAEIVKAKEINTEIDKVETKETTLQVHISDGKKFYETAPMMALLDKRNMKEIMRFQRTVDVSGQPRPQKVPAGDYYLVIVGREHKYTFECSIKANQNNSIMIPLHNGTIIFSYRGNPKRPITNYMALISRRFEQMVRVEQKVSEEKQFEPGTYNVRVNTLPPWHVSFELEIGTVRGVEIPEEGDLIITNNAAFGKVNLYYPLGDRFRAFLTINLDGSGKTESFKVLPGTYKAGYKKNPNLPLEEETMVEFTIKSNNVTTLELTK